MRDLRGSITIDANPEGINQYSGAASAAGKLSAAAIKADKGKDHEAAGKAHLAAAASHVAASKLAPGTATESWHKTMALAHAHQGAAHRAGRALPYKFGRNFGDNPTPTR